MTARIAVDAMGGDHAPHEIVAGALMAAEGLGVEVLLVGRRADVEREMERVPDAPGVRIVDASDVIEMEESPTDAVRAKPNASVNVGFRLVKEGEADALVTAGNTGAAMAAAMLTIGRVRGISRPALATMFPATHNRRSLLLDVGANSESRPVHLVQFAHMGSGYMRRMFDIERPRVGLLSIGEEDSKGNDLVVEVNSQLRHSKLNFIGNVEGKDLTRGVADVVVMDGFTGNVAVKTAEGVAELMFSELRTAVELTPWNKAAGFVLMPELRKVRQRMDYVEYGGAQLLGVEGLTVIAHGRSNARAVFSAIRAARDAVNNGVMETMREVAREVPVRRGLPGIVGRRD